MAMTEQGRKLNDRARHDAELLAANVYANFLALTAGKSQRELAETNGIDVQWLNTTLKSRNFTLRTLCKLADMTGVQPLDLLKTPAA